MRIGDEWKKEVELGRKLVEQQQRMPDPEWTSTPLQLPNHWEGGPPADGPAAGLPPLPELRRTSADVQAARARVAELAEGLAAMGADEAIALETGDADGLLTARRAREEATVRLWALQREAAVIEHDHFEAERRRIADYIDTYGTPLDKLRAEQRRLQTQEPPLEQALAYVEAALKTLDHLAGRTQSELERLKRGPSDYATTGAGGWS